jgi:hypothetical protein
MTPSACLGTLLHRAAASKLDQHATGFVEARICATAEPDYTWPARNRILPQ